jgi:hypothetical protein
LGTILVAGYFCLYRAVSPQELADVSSFGGFRPIPSSLQGKWFVQLDVPQDVADSLFRLANLDQIGQARYAEGELLDAISQTNLGITEVP